MTEKRHAVYILAVCCCMLTSQAGIVLRLLGGHNLYEGRLEIYDGGGWKSLCYDIWQEENTQVACRQLGFTGGTRKREDADTSIGNPGDFWKEDVSCEGQETTLDDCVFSGTSDTRCYHGYDDIYVTCRPNTDGVLRLQDGLAHNEGRLEIYHGEEWGTVCSGSDDLNDFPFTNVEVACRQLNYIGRSFRKVSHSERAPSSVDIWMDEVICLGSETRLENCTFAGWGTEHCHRNREDVFVMCDTYKDPFIRLTNGTDQYEGRLEIYHAREWGSVCIDTQDHPVLTAYVACRQLGFTGGSVRNEPYTEKTLRSLWMDRVKCVGDETNLEDCSFNGWRNTSCFNSFDKDIYLLCNPNEGDIRLRDGDTPYEGRVEIFVGGIWYSVCGDEWGNLDAKVVCRQLGLTGGLGQTQTKTGETLWEKLDIYCDGDETHLVKCRTSGMYCSADTVSKAACTVPAAAHNETCDPDIQNNCETSLKCQESRGFHWCLCDVESYWRKSDNECKTKLDNMDVCDPNIPGQCMSDLECRDINSDDYRCSCPTDDLFWDTGTSKCHDKLGNDEVCNPETPDQCTSDLVCRRTTEDNTKCLCPTKVLYWDGDTKQCQNKLGHDEVCNPEITHQCTSDMVCVATNADNKCLCPLDVLFWDDDTKQCQNKNNIRAVHVKESFNISEAINYCHVTYIGRVATEDHFWKVFKNCTNNVDEMWIRQLQLESKEEAPNLNECFSLDTSLEMKQVNCSESKPSVCIVIDRALQHLSCEGFPQLIDKDQLTSSSNAGLIGGVLSVVIVAIVCGIIGVLLLYRWRRNKSRYPADTDNNPIRMTSNSAYNVQYMADGNGRDSKPNLRSPDDYDYVMTTQSAIKPNSSDYHLYSYTETDGMPFTNEHCKLFENDGNTSTKAVLSATDDNYIYINNINDPTVDRMHSAGAKQVTDKRNETYSLVEGEHVYILPSDLPRGHQLDEHYSMATPTLTANNIHQPTVDSMHSAGAQQLTDKGNEIYSLANDEHVYMAPLDLSRDHLLDEHYNLAAPTQAQIPDEYDTFDKSDIDTSPDETYDHVHAVPDDAYDEFKGKASMNLTEDDEDWYMP